MIGKTQIEQERMICYEMCKEQERSLSHGF